MNIPHTLVLLLVMNASAPPRPDYSVVAAEIRASNNDLALALSAGRDSEVLVTSRVRATMMNQIRPLDSAIRLSKTKSGSGSGQSVEAVDPAMSPPDLMAVRTAADLLQLGAKTLMFGQQHERGVAALGGLFGLGAQLASDESLVSSNIASKVIDSAMNQFDLALQSDSLSQVDGQRLIVQMQRLDKRDPAGVVPGFEAAAADWVKFIANARAAGVSGNRDPLDISPYVQDAKPFAPLRVVSDTEWDAGVGELTKVLRKGRELLQPADENAKVDLCKELDVESSGAVARAVLSKAAVGSDYCIALGRAREMAAGLKERIAIAASIAEGLYDNRVAHRSAAYWVQRIRDQAIASKVDELAKCPTSGTVESQDELCKILRSGAMAEVLEAFSKRSDALEWDQNAYWLPRGVSVSEYACFSGEALLLWRNHLVCLGPSLSGQDCATALARWVRACRAACTAGPVTSQMILRAEIARQLEQFDLMRKCANADPSARAELARDLTLLGEISPPAIQDWCAKVRGGIADDLAFRLGTQSATQFQGWRAQAVKDLKEKDPKGLMLLSVLLDTSELTPSDRAESRLIACGRLFWEEEPSTKMYGLLASLKTWSQSGSTRQLPAVGTVIDASQHPTIDLEVHQRRLKSATERWRSVIQIKPSAPESAGR